MWKITSSQVSPDGSYATFSIEKSGNFLNKENAVRVGGLVQVWVSEEVKELSSKVLVGGDAVQSGLYTITAKTVKNAKGAERTELLVVGNQHIMKEVVVRKSGKQIYNWISDVKENSKMITFDKLEGDIEVIIFYWPNLTKKSVRFSK